MFIDGPNIILGNINEFNIELLFEGDENFIYADYDSSLACVLYLAKIFPSITQAKKNGFNKKINEGFSIIEIGKKNKKCVYIYKEKKMGLRFIKPDESIEQVFSDMLKEKNLTRGDSPNPVLMGYEFLKPVLVQNDNYLDCEYQLEFNGKIYSEEQAKKILTELGY